MQTATMTANDVIDLIERAAPDVAAKQFVWTAITVYFERLIDAPEQRLIAAGLRPFVAPIAADFALDRAEHAQSFHDFLEKLIFEQELVANLAIRAVRLYARRFSVMGNVAISKELSAELRFDMNATASRVWQNLVCIDPESNDF